MSNSILNLNKILKKIWLLLAVLILFIGVLSGIFRSLTPWAREYKGEIEHRLSVLIGQPVKIETMETDWYWFQPMLKLKQVTLGDGIKQNFHVTQLVVGINLFKSLWNWEFQPGVLFLDEVHLNFREKGSHWTIDGISSEQSNHMTPEKTRQILMWLSQQERLIMKHVSAFFYFNDGRLIPVDGLNVSIASHGGHYKFKGEARLAQTHRTEFKLFGHGYFNPDHIEDIEGQFYFSAKNIVPSQWQSFFPKVIEHLEGGKGDVVLWADVHHGVLSSVQAQVHFHRLAWRLLNNQNSQPIQSFFANLFWKPDNQGWQLQGDQIKLRIGEVNWPENQILIKYNALQENYQLFIKSIVIESLLANTINWPKDMKQILSMKPQGILKNTQVFLSVHDNTSSIPPIPVFNAANAPVFSETPPAPNSEEDSADKLKDINEKSSLVTSTSQGSGHGFIIGPYAINYILTRFEQLGWNAKDSIPQIKNLSGIINWQPDQGRLELDSENMFLKVRNYPAQTLTLVNSSLDWKELNDGLRVSIDRFILNQPELTLSMQGVMDQVSSQSAGNIRLSAEFSGQNWQKWMSFLPKKYMKPKLYLWLNQDLKRIDKASGTLILNGALKDFPFDNNNGEFSIEGYATGAELAINSQWQVVNEIDANIHLKNRNLNIDLVHANFQGAQAEQINLRIDDIGKNKENLIINGTIHAAMQKMMNYVLASPLKKKLTLLDMLSFKGSALLHLDVQVPLYPENDDVLVHGDLAFENNTLLVRHDLGTFPVKNITGKLMFHEHGVTDSLLDVAILEHPMNIKIQSIEKPQSVVTIEVNGKCTVDSLKNRFKLPLLDLVEGSFDVNTVLRLTNKSSDPNHITLTSSLVGLSINLPEPLGKEVETSVPLKLDLELDSQKSLRLKGNYDERLGADLLFKKSDEGFSLHSGQMRLGGANAMNRNVPGFSVVGVLKKFDIQKWKEIVNRFSSGQPNTLLTKLRIINITIEKFSFLKQQVDALTLKASMPNPKEWHFSVMQKNIAADLVYNIPKTKLSGHAQYLHLDKLDTLGDESLDSPLVRPNQIPNLDLRIDDFSFGKIHVGSVTLNSKSFAEKWIMDSCQIDSPFYQFNVQGEWVQQDNNKNRTSVDVALNLKDLAKAQEQWNITPVVHAKKGYMEFHGGWKNSLYKFSPASLHGGMSLTLRNGRITHLSREAEEKLGLGKLLSILSLQTLPRRLQLDFSDLAHQGYSFDVFQGNFAINKGIMSTHDSSLEGPVASASMKGDFDLGKRTYDLNLNISPHITASLPVVATIAGGPVAGVAVWVANNIITQGILKISAYSYKVTGPWNKPVIQQLSIIKKK